MRKESLAKKLLCKVTRYFEKQKLIIINNCNLTLPNVVDGATVSNNIVIRQNLIMRICLII